MQAYEKKTDKFVDTYEFEILVAYVFLFYFIMSVFGLQLQVTGCEPYCATVYYRLNNFFLSLTDSTQILLPLEILR
jgi:hypothetical protein